MLYVRHWWWWRDQALFSAVSEYNFPCLLPTECHTVPHPEEKVKNHISDTLEPGHSIEILLKQLQTLSTKQDEAGKCVLEGSLEKN